MRVIDVPTPRVMAIGIVAYAFALNIGAVVGGAGFRLRMYTREGCRSTASRA
jgi:uncharacterized membrane protein YbhN (UPF0104 family)